MTSQRIERLRSQAGYTLAELLTAVAIFSVLAATALPHLDPRRYDIQSTAKQVISDYRWTRARAITSGTHFALKWTADDRYEIQRLKQTGAEWTLDEVVKDVELPSTIMRWGWPDSVEFNTRGMMISSESTNFQGLADTQFGTWRLIAVWPSGQTHVYE